MGAPRKKICAKCGRKLWLRDFYRSSTGVIASRCKECSREDKRQWYADNRKKEDRVYYDQDKGRAMVHEGFRTAIHWSGAMIEKLKRIFPMTKNEDCAIELGVSPRTVIRKARELGLSKNEEWRINHARNNCRIMRIYNQCRGNSGMIKPGEHRNPAGEFKPKAKV